MSSDSVKIKCFKFRLYPSRSQQTVMEKTLDTLRLVYNSLLNERKFLYETTGKSVSQYTQEKHFAEWRKEFPELEAVHSHLLQNAALRVNLAMTAFFRRVKLRQAGTLGGNKDGETPGYPRFKGVGQYDSFSFKEFGNGVIFKGGKLSVSKIGHIKGAFHRELEGVPKTATIRRQAGKWFVSIACEVVPEPLPHSEEAVGIDVGLKTFAALSNGEMIENPRFFRRDETALAKAQRKAAKYAKRTKERNRANKVIRRIHERIRNRRHDFCHQNARRIVNRYGVIAIEKLNVRNMSKAPEPKPDPDNEGQFLPNGASAKAGLNKSILDAAWSQFRSILATKAESAAREVYHVNPAFTTQDCSACGYRPDGLEGRTKKKLSDRWHWCPMCGLSVDRDTNAAINILNLCGATQSQRLAAVEAAWVYP